MSKYYSIEPCAGKTRKCLDLWGKCLIKANGDVWLCCNGTLVGNLRDAPLADILNNQKSQAYRQGLLDGKPLPACKHCVDRPTCSIQELHEVVQDFYDTGKFF
jgi:radical SAM protein with 4Fe4S-binding SPASM domain